MTDSSTLSNGSVQNGDTSAQRQVVFSPDQYAALLKLADDQKIGSSDAIDQAIGITKFVVEVINNKGERLLVQRGQQLRELTLE